MTSRTTCMYSYRTRFIATNSTDKPYMGRISCCTISSVSTSFTSFATSIGRQSTTQGHIPRQHE